MVTFAALRRANRLKKEINKIRWNTVLKAYAKRVQAIENQPLPGYEVTRISDTVIRRRPVQTTIKC